MKNTLLTVLVAIVAATSSLKAETLSIYDDSFIVNGAPSLAVGKIISGRWGQWNSGTATFSQAIVTSLAAGYVDLTPSAKELSITLNQTTTSTYASGSLMALAIFASNSADSQALNWSLTAGGAKQASVVAYAVLTDASWIAPLFANNATPVDFTFTANTQAVIGSFSGGAADGAGIQTIVMIPEPSSASLLALGMAGLVALRARRKS
jgi:PEP-CTERM motif